MENYFTSQKHNIFRNVAVLIYVFDVQSDQWEKDMEYYTSCLSSLREVRTAVANNVTSEQLLPTMSRQNSCCQRRKAHYPRPLMFLLFASLELEGCQNILPRAQDGSGGGRGATPDCKSIGKAHTQAN
jgi:hypothetical protein